MKDSNKINVVFMEKSVETFGVSREVSNESAVIIRKDWKRFDFRMMRLVSFFFIK